MRDLIIDSGRIDLPARSIGILRAEFDNAGLFTGRLTIGDVSAEPGLVYFLWHDAGEIPVSMTTERARLNSDEDLRAAARIFMTKWERRMGAAM
jgi:hypothetical protein